MTSLFENVRELLRIAVLTQAVVRVQPGPREYGNPLADRLVHAAHEAYGWSQTDFMKFQASPKDVSVYLDVLSWLAWFNRDKVRNRQKVSVFIGWALDKPMYAMCARHKRGEETIRNWRDDVVRGIIKKFKGDCEKIALDYFSQETPDERHSADIATQIRPSPRFIRARDAKPIRGAAQVEGSPAALDREKTIKRLERNARKSARRKRRAAA